jgi:hypothetical protein
LGSYRYRKAEVQNPNGVSAKCAIVGDEINVPVPGKKTEIKTGKKQNRHVDRHSFHLLGLRWVSGLGAWSPEPELPAAAPSCQIPEARTGTCR